MQQIPQISEEHFIFPVTYFIPCLLPGFIQRPLRIWYCSHIVCLTCHDDVIKWKHFPRYWLFVRGIHRSPVDSPRKGQWRGALMFSFIYARTNYWANNGNACDLKRHRAYYDVTVMLKISTIIKYFKFPKFEFLFRFQIIHGFYSRLRITVFQSSPKYRGPVFN